MVAIPEAVEFEWDEGNLHKSYIKHGIIPNQAEQVFIDKNVIIYDDQKHSQVENRLIAIGKIETKIILFIIYTLRGDKIRIVSARRANTKERRLYENLKKNPAL